MKLFLDLEETIIDDFTTKVILNDKIKNIKNLIKKIEKKQKKKFTSITIFSMAITSLSDVRNFKMFLQETIERIFNIPVEEIFLFNRNNIISLIKKEAPNFLILETDFLADFIFGDEKTKTFLMHCEQNEKSEFCVLFDDVVKNKQVRFHLDDMGENTLDTTIAITIRV